MGPSSDLAGRVTKALESASPVDVQKIAEQFGRIQFPERFGHLEIYGRNIGNQTIAGWPDAWAMRGGRIDAIEATRDQKWQKHIEKDFEKAQQMGSRLGGFVFVATHPRARCSPPQRATWEEKFCRLGVQREHVNIYVGMTFVDNLCRPEFARLRSELLGIHPNPQRFQLVAWSDELEELAAFSPTRREFREGRVYRPAITDKVLERLALFGWAVVLGTGASGKTMLGRLVTRERRFTDLPSYYLDLAPYLEGDVTVANEAAADIVNFGDPNVLFVIDNIHLNERLAHDILDAWRPLAVSRPCLLFLGRETRHRGSAGRFSDPAAGPIPLRAQEAESLGVYRRLALRSVAEADLAMPPRERLSAWVNTFGGSRDNEDTSVDLMVLSAALQHRMDHLLEGDWTLAEHHARDEVAKQYLSPVGPEERRNLIRLAMMPEDFRLNIDAFVHRVEGFSQSLRKGLVFESEVGQGKHRYYRFVHPALARLLREASDQLPSADEEYKDVAVRAPFNGFILARRLVNEERLSEAAKVLRAIVRSPDWLSRFGGHLEHLRLSIELLTAQGIMSWNEIDAMLNNAREVDELGLRTPLDLLASFLRYSEAKSLRATRQSIVTGLNRHSARFADLALRAPLTSLRAFLSYAQRSELASVRGKVIEKLAQASEHVAAVALKSPFDAISGFLEFATQTDLASTRQNLLTDLLKEESVAALAARAPHEPLSSLVDLLGIDALGEKIVASLDVREWNKCRLAEEAQQPYALVPLIKKLTAFNRLELAQAPARNQIVGRRVASWTGAKIKINDLANILRLAKSSPEENGRFIAEVVTTNWLEMQYRDATTGGLAGALFWIATQLDPLLWPRFLHPSLNVRVKADLERCSAESPMRWAEALSLLGAFSIMGGETSSMDSLSWPRTDILTQVIRTRALGPRDQRISTVEFQLWLGLREMAHRNLDQIKVPRDDGERILARARANLPYATSPTGITHKLIDWLENSERAGWTLARGTPGITG